MIKIENQLDKRWDRCYIGKVKTSSFHNFACYLFCWTYIYSIKLGKQISPLAVDKIFVDNGVYAGDQIINEKAAKALGLQYLGHCEDINNPPKWHPSVKRVDYSARPGKQYHFVVRTVVDGKNVILDPIDGVQREINHYEKKVKVEGKPGTAWGDGGFSYRSIKI